MVFTKKCNFAQKHYVRTVYSFLIQLVWYFLQIIAKFNQKIKYFVEGRKRTFATLEAELSSSNKLIWIHVASLGEYEQGLPILEQLKIRYPNYKVLLTFFSPSGFEVKKDKTPADVVVYLPMDSTHNTKRFLEITKPKLAIFIKYEIWPNYLNELQKRSIPTLLVSGIFSPRQVFFKWYGSFMRKSLNAFTHFFVQDDKSKRLLNEINFQNVTVSGDTRFDRVSKILQSDNSLEFMEVFKGKSKCLVVGSSWPEDEAVLLDYINESNVNLKFVIAPHNIKQKHIEGLKNSIEKRVMLHSQIDLNTIADYQVLLIDAIGILTKIYSYADFAYVGGGFATGLHNTLEPAVFGIPVIIGPQYSGFNEAVEMVNRKGILVVNNKKDFETKMKDLLENPQLSKTTGNNNLNYIQAQTGASTKVIDCIQSLL